MCGVSGVACVFWRCVCGCSKVRSCGNGANKGMTVIADDFLKNYLKLAHYNTQHQYRKQHSAPHCNPAIHILMVHARYFVGAGTASLMVGTAQSIETATATAMWQVVVTVG